MPRPLVIDEVQRVPDLLSYIQVILDRRPAPLPIEIKSAMTWHPDFFLSLRRFANASGATEPGVLVYGGDIETTTEARRTQNFKHAAKLFS